MSDYTKNNIGSGYNTTTSLNAELEKVETAVNSKLDKTGGSLSGDLSMESNDLLNVNTVSTAALTIAGQPVVATGDVTYANSVKELQTATAGQTLFTLSTFTYTAGANNLNVFVNGVRLVQTDYTETSNSSVTLANARSAGDLVEFVYFAPTDVLDFDDASQVTYQPDGGVATTVQAKLRETVSVKDFGAVGDGVTDDTVAIQAALDLWAASQGDSDDGLELIFPKGRYLVSSPLTAAFTENCVASGKIAFQSSEILSTVTGKLLTISLSGVLIRNFRIDDMHVQCGGNETQVLAIEAGTTGSASIYRFMINRPVIEKLGGGNKGIVIADNTFECMIVQPNIAFLGGAGRTAVGGYGIWTTNAGGGNVSSVDIYGGTISGGEYNIYDQSGGVKLFGGTFLESGSYNVYSGNTSSSIESCYTGCHFENGQQDSADTSLVRIDGIGTLIGCHGTANSGGATTLLRAFPVGDGIHAYGLVSTGNIVDLIDNRGGSTSSRLYTDTRPSKIVAASNQEARILTSCNEGVYQVGTTSGSVTMDMDYGNAMDLTVSGAFTIENPSNPLEGQRLVISILQDGTGGHAVTWGSDFTPTPSALDTTASTRTTYQFVHISNSWRQL